ncbi:MAG: ammonium transporter [Robiginitomaculum sp.]|nr:ammonium transporter [Robiginitomaculum sp.]MDQ7076899.1 ammonium transporter [Robiginitomaculum sp.]
MFILQTVTNTPDLTARLADLEKQLAGIQQTSAFVDNTYLFLISGMVVMFMAAGFCMLETGLVRQKNAATIALKNVSIYALAGLAYYIVGYRLMYDGVDGGFFGHFALWSPGKPDGESYSSSSDWFFQMAFVATAASVVSGTLAERIKLWPFLFFSIILCAIFYPITGSWVWGSGWLSTLHFSDFAGSTLVHSVGGWAALTGAVLLGARKGKYPGGKAVSPMPGSNLPLAALGTFILWFGWFGFNGGSQLAAGTIADIDAVAKIFVNTNAAAAAGLVMALVLTQIIYKKADLTLVLNGAIGGLVSITAEPLAPAVWQAIAIGAVGGIIVVLAVPLLDRLKIDDVVGAIPAHLFCGIWGTLIVAWTNQADGTSWVQQLSVQALGVVTIGAFTVVASSALWLILKTSIGIRCTDEEEFIGLDKAELGLEAYPEFAQG